ncbi:hypothetical protein ASPCAL12927 [Aspergillus calidoustus]|uniref:Uncharacterized protein n=1 Tax=Aspergillus calidoustus TaxID=454130 RepID=A0A0U5GDB7_ASPCI|nr:hypothetical protein ASPCAL12927 [Aspergillus calidoustus]
MFEPRSTRAESNQKRLHTPYRIPDIHPCLRTSSARMPTTEVGNYDMLGARPMAPLPKVIHTVPPAQKCIAQNDQWAPGRPDVGRTCPGSWKCCDSCRSGDSLVLRYRHKNSGTDETVALEKVSGGHRLHQEAQPTTLQANTAIHHFYGIADEDAAGAETRLNEGDASAITSARDACYNIFDGGLKVTPTPKSLGGQPTPSAAGGN